MKFKSIRNLFRKATVMSALFFAISSSMAACSFTFEGSEKFGSLSDEVTGTFVNAVSEIVENTNFRDDMQTADLGYTSQVLAEGYGEAKGVSFVKASITRVVDGDTIVVDIGQGDVKVRLIGVNTPESVASQEYLDKMGKENTEEGKNASNFVKDLLSKYDNVYLQSDVSAEDKYGRSLYYVWLEMPQNERDIDEIRTKMLEGILLDKGYAEVSIYKPNVSYADEFAAIEAHTTDEWENDR